MPTCPRCHQSVDAQAIACPHCRTSLKAYGHPGIPLHRAGSEEYLCQSCIYDQDDTCNYPQRPYAKECMLYTNQTPLAAQRSKASLDVSLTLWIRRNAGWLILLAVALIIILRTFS
ncbi:MAG: zinc ribbon domain-containing protein [Oculatellaceae cyanobacterium Prado106]|jgi:hypothetical protein|nr:zinc ribbon domain-containing protein [Oculatellaceae cyanobacterium Prado106]